MIVDDDVPTFVQSNAGLFKPQVVGIRTAAYGKKHVRSVNFGGAWRAIDMHNGLIPPPGKADALRIQADVDVFASEDFQNGRRYIFVFPLNQARAHLHDGNLASESPEHLPELQPDIAAAYDD